ncbi:MAG TPA: phosphate propanoyltransferase [Bacillota bacterium]|nr:phosphate propanoyltransferase [Bacillota bacterium]
MNKILVETSARHVHLTREDVDILFGEGYELTLKKALSQPGQFASNEKVNIEGPKGVINNVSILGPIRPRTQVEISLTDARKLGINAPVKESGDLDNTPGCRIFTDKGEVNANEGVIVAQRHIHLTPDTAKEFGLCEKQVVSVKLDTADRALTFGNVVVRVSEKFAPAMHIDTDESNAACAFGTIYGEIIK